MAVNPHPKEPGKWVIDYYEVPPRKGQKGLRIRKVIKCEQAEAFVIERKLRQMHNPRPSVNPRVVDIFPEFLDWLKLHRSKRYHEDVEKAFIQLKPFFGNIQLSKITPILINEYKRDRPRPTGIHQGKDGICAINKELKYLGTFQGWAVKHGYAMPLPFKIEKLPYKPELQEIVHPSVIDRFLSEIKPRGKKLHNINTANLKKALVLFMFDCGLRWKEARAVRWEKIDWQTDTVYLEDTKGDEPDMCILTEGLRTLLEPLKRAEGWVFENPRTGKPWQSMKTIFKGASDRADIKRLRPHQLRRTSANLMMDATEDLRSVQEFLRHKSVNTTMIYLRRNKARVKRAMAKTAAHIDSLKKAQEVEKKEEKK